MNFNMHSFLPVRTRLASTFLVCACVQTLTVIVAVEMYAFPGLCLLVALVHVRSQTHERANSYVHERSGSFSQDYEANRWHSFYSWSRNSPAARQHAAASVVVDAKPDGSSRELMLIYGGECSTLESVAWIYDIHSNSWEAVDRESVPPAVAMHTMVTLCQRRVLSFGGYRYADGSGTRMCSNETWIFDMARKEWSLATTTLHPNKRGTYIAPRCRHAATVVRDDSSRCRCKESMLVYGGSALRDSTWGPGPHAGALRDLWLLRCNDDANQIYEWIRLSEKGPKLCHPAAVSVFNKTMMYVFGAIFPGQYWTVWSFCLANKTWSRQSVDNKKRESAPGRGVYMTTNRTEHFLVSCCAKPLTVFDLVRRRWFRPEQSGPHGIPSFQASSAITADVGGREILAFGRPFFVIDASHNWMWRLTILVNGSWHWSVEKTRASSSLSGRSFMVAGLMATQEEALLFGGTVLGGDVEQLGSDNNLHRLDLNTRRWSVEVIDIGNRLGPTYGFRATGTVLAESIMIVYGGFTPPRCCWLKFLQSLSPRIETWGYYNDVRMWVKYETQGREPTGRVFHSAVATGFDTMVIYGGFILLDNGGGITRKMKVRRDLWMFTLFPSNNDSADLSAQETDSYWRLIDSVGPGTSYLTSLVAIDDTLYLYGGSDTIIKLDLNYEEGFSVLTLSASCKDNLWTYNLSCGMECTWRAVPYGDIGPGRRCVHEAFAYGDHMLVTGGCFGPATVKLNFDTYLSQYQCHVESSTSGVWLYKPAVNTWFHLTAQSMYHSGIFGTSSLLWNDLLLSFGGLPHESLAIGQVPKDWLGFSFYRPACPAGTTTSDLKIHVCTDCPLGYFAASPDSACVQCPDGLTTVSPGSTSRANCSRCVRGYCGYGVCTVALQGPAPSCTCRFGFTKDDDGLCNEATYYIAGTGFVAGLALLVLVFVLLAKARTVRKRHSIVLRDKDSELSRRNVILEKKDRELIELTNSWNIDSKELRLRRRIDNAYPGAYGEVHEGEYREMIVAVKKLQGVHRPINRIYLEFEREIEVMRTIRHPNIVLFLGGGRYHDDGCPFLVVEYMPRGSLTTILSNQDIYLDDDSKLRFATDAAKGMRFLHSQRPPRIHRDLKSGNLLVSQKWVVKVADFGAARLVKDEGVCQDAVRGEGFLDQSAPLLHADYQLSSGVGTPSWCAPEILCGQRYGTPADVYR